MRCTFILSLVLLAGAGCQTSRVQNGALLGGALGAGTGAVLGHQVDKQGEGALIGAGIGALTGALVGDQVNQAEQRSYAPTTVSARRTSGHYEKRLVRSRSGEMYEDRVWVPAR